MSNDKTSAERADPDGLGSSRRIIGLGRLLLAAWVLALHVRVAWWWGGAELASSDPPAHLTSGVMVYDYVRSALGTDPLKFAESFYVRYPKVAIGHWPPAYYGVQALWYCLFGASVWSAQALSAATAFGLGFALFRRMRADGGSGAACMAALLFLAMPLVQRAAWQVMSDLLTGLFVFLALLAFADLLDGASRVNAGLRFLGWSLLAVLTKGTAWALGPFVLLAPWLAGRAGRCREPWYWGGGLLLAASGSLFFLAMQAKGMGYPVNFPYLVKKLAHAGWREWLFLLQPFLQFAPAVVLALAVVGAGDALRRRWRFQDPSCGTTDALVAAAWILSQAVFLVLLPMTGEVRALLPSLAPAALLATRGAQALAGSSGAPKSAALLVLLATLAVASSGFAPIRHVQGYARVAKAIPYPARGVPILISSDSAGEGAFVVERLLHDPRRAGIVLRASQMLTKSNWMGTISKPLFDSPEAVREHLQSLGVRYVALDRSALDAPLQALLARAVEEDGPAGFVLLGKFPVLDEEGMTLGRISLYENPAADQGPKTLRIRLGAERGGRVLEYAWPGNPD